MIQKTARRQPDLLDRPPAMLIDRFIDLPHDADRLVQGDDDAPVVIDVLGREEPAGLALFGAAVLEPLLAHLVAADTEVPYGPWRAKKSRKPR